MCDLDRLEAFICMGMNFTSNGGNEGGRVVLENLLQAAGQNQSIQSVGNRFLWHSTGS